MEEQMKEYVKQVEDKKEEFHQLIETIEDLKILEYLLTFTKLLIKRWGH